ncbi:hypothetical protein MRX96_011042 [Rhipicephalus microplus]
MEALCFNGVLRQLLPAVAGARKKNVIDFCRRYGENQLYVSRQATPRVQVHGRTGGSDTELTFSTALTTGHAVLTLVT